MASSINGCSFATIAIIDLEDQVTIATAFDLRTAGKIAALLCPDRRVQFVPVFSDTWHYDTKHAVTTIS